MIYAAPYLTKRDRCSECNADFVWAGNHDLKICPQCYALLWHEDWSIEQRRAVQAAATAAAKLKAEKERQKRQAKEASPPQPQSQGGKFDITSIIPDVITSLEKLEKMKS